MNNKKYLDKVIGSLVRGTRIDYENVRITFPFPLPSPFIPSFSIRFMFSYFSLVTSSPVFFPRFSTYCKNTFGLTEKEIDYVWKKYKDIIKDKISNREP